MQTATAKFWNPFGSGPYLYDTATPWMTCRHAWLEAAGGRTLSKAFIKSPYVSLERRSHSQASIRLQFHVASTNKTKQTISLNRKWLPVFLHNEKEALQKWQCSVFVCNIANRKIIAENIERQTILVLRVEHASKMIQEKRSIHPVSAASLSYFQCSPIFLDARICL